MIMRYPSTFSAHPKLRLASIALALMIGLTAVPAVFAATEGAVPVRTVSPEYPMEMRRDGINGVVTVVFYVDEHGNVVEPSVLKSTNSAFEQPALKAIASWKFRPAKQDGVPVRSRVAIPMQFTSASS